MAERDVDAIFEEIKRLTIPERLRLAADLWVAGKTAISEAILAHTQVDIMRARAVGKAGG